MNDGLLWIEGNQALIADINDKIWAFAETGLKEADSASCLTQVLMSHGFTVTAGVAGMPTAFVATYGVGSPSIGFLAEYDALPGLGADISLMAPQSGEPSPPGHGCGHNTLAAAIMGGALGLVAAIKSGNLSGQVVVFGCPAEELLIGKVKMAKEHLFDSCDVLLSCHPNDVSYVWARSSNAVWSGKFQFHGVTAHAAIDPENGRSALDAVELMNVGANYLREHVSSDVRIHYVTTQGGEVPNIVPSKAEVWYTLRAKDNQSVKSVADRVENLAKGASIMTDTTYHIEPVSGCADLLRNRVLENLLLSNMKQIGPPDWDEKNFEFAQKLSEKLPGNLRAQALTDYSIEARDAQNGLHCGIYNGFYREGQVMAVSTDVGDASWQVPTGVFSFASTILGSPGHSWYYTVSCGSDLAHKGAVMASKVLTQTALDLLTDKKLLAQVKDAYKKEKNNRKYQNFFALPKTAGGRNGKHT